MKIRYRLSNRTDANQSVQQNSMDKKLPCVIFPFSEDPNLSGDNLPGLEVYENYLQIAFDEPRIHNIVVSGGFGVGKSSIVRAFERHYVYKQKTWIARLCSFIVKIPFIGNTNFIGTFVRRSTGYTPKFLYITLGDYQRHDDADIHQDKVKPTEGGNSKGGEPEESTCTETDSQQNALERRLLLQIYARFRKKDLQLASFQMVQERHLLFEIITTLCCTSIIALALSLYLLQNETDITIGSITSIEWPDVQQYFRLAFIVLVTLAAFTVIHQTAPLWKFKAASVKLSSFEADCERTACEDYLDQHTTELIYCLGNVAKDVHNTVVFEDLDRLDESTCLTILARLREINHLINLRMTDQCMRFVYVVNETVLAQLQHEKYADYILPVVPQSNVRTSEYIFSNNISLLDSSICDKNGHLTEPIKSIVHISAPYLSDYRLQFAVLNDYGILYNLYCSNNPDSFNSMKEAKGNIFAFSIYKNLYPDDYSAIWQGKSFVFPIYDEDALISSGITDTTLLDALANGDNKFLTANSLYYISCSKDQIVKLFMQRLRDNCEQTIAETKNRDFDLLRSAVDEYCKELKENLSNSLDDDIDSKVQSIILYLIEEDEPGDFSWFFNREIPIEKALRILSDDIFTNEMLLKIYRHTGWNPEGTKCLYERLYSKSGNLWNIQFANRRETEVLRLGVGRGYQSTNRLSYYDDQRNICSVLISPLNDGV